VEEILPVEIQVIPVVEVPREIPELQVLGLVIIFPEGQGVMDLEQGEMEGLEVSQDPQGNPGVIILEDLAEIF
jgi:hypothetical protein